ncbi:hypothetical protein G3U99_25490 (plasmid) [Vibrio coralliilyticus OCN008]|uniref:hypothetical protein n=1 Tax=Vibrio coralliilyticus TaxID=190893 RepID=UPI000390B39E|nr:hypothetical protein [Vibrio coralliilyticus]ERB64204.1 hypothetical protein N779_16800 [Vibrio coralliilyticus OCN008]QIJ87643.1 hypothetical protein G3U99_25490 [Vibrio coralliilyticus OCN008]
MREGIDASSLHQIPEAVTTVLNQFTSYDEPCLVLLYSDAPQEVVDAAFEQVLEQNRCEASNWLVLETHVRFCHMFCNYQNANFFAFDLTDILQQQGYQAKVSLFRHHCLGQPEDTYRWNITQLLALLETDDPVAINDFCDTRHWQGISQYVDADQEARLMAPKEQTEAHAPSPDGDCIVAPLQSLSPFIVHLPQGEALWHYVLTGEFNAPMPLETCLRDLDSVLVIVHAKRHSPDFYRHLLRTCHYDSVPPQHAILRSLADVLRPLYQGLLSAPHDGHRQQCFLRVLDIFFHLFDQQDLPKAWREILVKDDDTACLSAFEFERRYTQPCDAPDNGIGPRTKRNIDHIIDSLDNFFACDHEDYQEIERVFGSNRHAFNHQLWQRDEEEQQTRCRLIGAMLLSLDHETGQFDDYTDALLKWVSDGLHQDVHQEIRRHCTRESEHLSSWLLHGHQEGFAALVDELSSTLNHEMARDVHATLGVAQPKYDLFSSVGAFRPMLATCYWLYKANQDAFAKRVILLSMALAPQATIASMSRLYRDAFRGFAAAALRRPFFAPLHDMGISDADLSAFQISLAVQYDESELEGLIHRYAAYDQDERNRWNVAINKLASYERDYFYLNVHRLHPQLSTPLRDFRPMVVRELMSAVAKDGVDIHTLSDATLRFLNGELRFRQYQRLTHGHVDVDQFDLPPDYYTKAAPKILPQILVEPELTSQLRWIQLLCCQSTPLTFGGLTFFRRPSTHNDPLQTLLLEQVFFEQCWHEGNLSFSDRQTIELDDLTPEYLEYWHQYQRHMARKIKRL